MATIAPGPIGTTGFVHPSLRNDAACSSIGGASLIEPFVSFTGVRVEIGVGCNLQDNDRLLDFARGATHTPGDLVLGDGAFTAHGVTFVGRVRIGAGCGCVINAVVQNAEVGDGSIVGPMARILGEDPERPIVIPAATMVMFGACIRSQADVAANTIPVPAPFSLFAADVAEENLVLARGYNLLFRAASRITPFSAAVGDPRNPGADFPDVAAAFGKLSVAPSTAARRGTTTIPTRPATMGDLSFARFEPQARSGAPANDEAASGARFVVPRVASPELIDDGAIVIGGCDLGPGVVVGAGSCLHAADAPAVAVGARTRIGKNSSLHELTLTSCYVGEDCVIGDRVVLHGPLVIGNRVRVGDGSVVFGPTVADGVTIGKNALVFGPVEITSDVPDGGVVVAAGMEALVAPAVAR